MSLITADRVKDSTTTTGTGSVTLAASPPSGYQAFSTVMAVNDTCYYCIASQGGTEWEVGYGTLTASTTLSRDTVLASSNAGALVTFSAGTKDVFIDVPAARLAPPLQPQLPMRTGGTFYYSSLFIGGGNTAAVRNTLYATPFYVATPTTFVSIGVVTTGTASALVDLGIYADAGGVPGALVLDAGTVSTATSGFKTITISKKLTPGWYWLACAMQGAAGSLFSAMANTGNVNTMPCTAPFSTGAISGYAQTGVSGALPSPWGATYNDTLRCPVVFIAPA